MQHWLFPEITAEKETSQSLFDITHNAYENVIGAITDYELSDNKACKLPLIEAVLESIHAAETVLHYYGITHREFNDGLEYIKLMHSLSGDYSKDERSNAEKNNVQNGTSWVR